MRKSASHDAGRLARLREAEKHPNEEDFHKAAAWALEMVEKAGC